MTRPDWESTDRVLSEKRLFRPAKELVEQSNLAAFFGSLGFEDWDQLYSWSIERPDEFWPHVAQELHWFKTWDRVLQWEPPYAKWFTGAQCNIVYNALDRHMQTFRRNKVAFYWEGEDGSARTISYAELYRDVNRFASALRAMGVERGDRVSIYLPRIPEQIIAMLGTARVGAVHSVTYSGFSAQALRERIEDADAKVVITADGYYYRGKVVALKGAVDEAVKGCPSVQKVVVVPRLGSQVPMVEGRDLFWDEALGLGASQEPCAVMDSGDMLYILYTSGTTGKPKGVVHVHGGYMVGIYATLKLVFDTKEADVYWCTADPGWVTGHSYIVYAPLIAGITSVFYEGAIDYPDPGRWWSIIEKYQVSLLYTTPTAIRGLMRFGDQWPAMHDLSCLRLLGTVGEPINPEAWIWYRRVTGDRLPIMDTWWQTETGMQMITPTIPLPLKPGSAGKPFLGIVADVVDRQGNPVGADKGGFLIIRRPWPAMMSGIYKDPARYEEYWTIIGDAYFTGDAAHRDADGYFWIQGRVDDVIKKSGYRLGTMEIESALVSHPGVAEAAVIGKPDPLKGESIKAFVILRSGESPSTTLAGHLKRHVRETVGPIAAPDEIEFVDSLPKTRSGKIMRRVLKARELGQPVGDLSTLE